MTKLLSFMYVLCSVALYHPYAEAQRGSSGGTRGGGSSSSGSSSSRGSSGSSAGSSSSSRGSSGSSSSSSSSRGSSSSGSASNSGSRGSSSSGSSSSSGGYTRGSSSSGSSSGSGGSSSSSSSSRGSSSSGSASNSGSRGSSSSGSSSSSGGYTRGSSSSGSSSSSGGYTRGSSSSGSASNSGSRGSSSSGSSSSSGGYTRGSSSSGSSSSSGGYTRGSSSSGSASNSGSRGNSSANSSSGYTRSAVAAPGLNSGRTQVSGYSRGGRDNVVYTDSRSGRTVLREEYARDRSYVTRTFYDRYENSRSYQYNRVVYRTTYVYVYQPVYVYSGYHHWYTPFCASAYYVNPWSYSWSWTYDPWYDYYYRRHYFPFRPYARYVYPSQWLVDYYWASLLADEYEDQYQSGVISSQQQTIAAQQSTIDAQQAEIDLLKDQLQRQIDQELQARSQGSTVSLDTKLLDPARVYVMSASMTLVTADASAITCNLSSGDVISLSKEGVAPNGATATMLVRTAKAGNCAAGSKVLVSIEQLQEFENEFNRRLDMGAEQMKSDPNTASVLRDI